MATRGRRVHSIEKAVTLLDCFWEAGSDLSLSELEKRTGWAKSTIHGLLASMIDSGVVEQNMANGRYRLGYHLFELGSAVRLGWDIPAICAPLLKRIVDALGESAYLARLSGEELILVACEEPHNGFRITSEVGSRLPPHCSSQGKAILANRSKHEAQRLLTRSTLTAFTPATITEPARLLAMLPEIRAQGYAEERQEYKQGLQSVAAPIFERDGSCRYAIGVVCMAGAEKDFAAMREAVMQAAKEASHGAHL